MDLTTRCPECGTTFAASLAQLQLRKGYIRCVNCAHIFDGFDAVVPGSKPVARAAGTSPEVSVAAQPPRQAVADSPVLPPAPLPNVVRQRSAAPVPSGVEPVITPVPAAAPAASPDNFRIPVRDVSAASVHEPRFTVSSAPVSSYSSIEPSLDPSVAVRRRRPDDDEDEPGLYIEPRSPDSPDAVPGFLRYEDDHGSGLARVFWTALVFLGLVLAAAQLVYIYRPQVATLLPAARPYLVQLCQSLHCTVPYARQIDRIVITSSSLRSGSVPVSSGAPQAPAPAKAPGGQASTEASKADKGESGTLVLGVVLRNTYDQPQEWPVLVVSLTDFSGTRVARKNITPAQYLGADQLAGPFPAGAEAEISVPLELKGLQINGYQLDKFFP